MARADIISNGAGLKMAVANSYSCHGPAFTRRLAKEYLAQVGAAVSEIEGREVAANLLFRATDAVLAGIPVGDIGDEPEVPDGFAGGFLAAQAKAVTLLATTRQRAGRAVLWWLCGLISAQPVFWALRRMTGW